MYSKGSMLEKNEGITAETQMGETVFYRPYNSRRWSHPVPTDITEQKKHEQQMNKKGAIF